MLIQLFLTLRGSNISQMMLDNLLKQDHTGTRLILLLWDHGRVSGKTLASLLTTNGAKLCATRFRRWVFTLSIIPDQFTQVLVEISLADSGSLTTAGLSDGQANFEIERLPPPTGRIREPHFI